MRVYRRRARQQRAGKGVRALYAWLRAVHSTEHRAAKAVDFGRFSVFASVITAVFVANTWLWDYAIDPVHMGDAFGLRMLQTVSVMALAVVMWRAPAGLAARIGLLVVPAFVQLTFIEVLARLDDGSRYGVGGFLYFFIFVPFMAQAQSLRFNALLLALLALLPNLWWLAGVGAHLDLSVYNAYMWMAFPPVVTILAGVEYLVDQLYRHRAHLARSADTDALTGLRNRRSFLMTSRRLLSRARRDGVPVSVLFVDADHFKAINDRYGHSFGDQVLRILAHRIASMSRHSDLVARYGGEEFVLLLPDTDAEMAERVAERIRRHVSAGPIETPGAAGASVAVTVSVGIATASPDGHRVTLDDLVEAADGALYSAKGSGRNRTASGLGAEVRRRGRQSLDYY
ncbi:diguanylate cyclase [Arhodomonas sp. AD133]|uniref:GGDEF domain-containing protein n=1 Tax=Arhodomonas sp. AD133 TaxID=3415009 RepID=UPI003EBCD06F